MANATAVSESVQPSCVLPSAPLAPPFGKEPKTGRRTNTITVSTSSTKSQPTAIWPAGECKLSASERTRMSRTVLATAMAMPMTMAVFISKPRNHRTDNANRVVVALSSSAPGKAVALTAMSSWSLKWRPTPNMRRMTPISASSCARSRSPMNPGVLGPMRTPASR